MADLNVAVILAGKDQASGAIKNVIGSLGDLGKSVGSPQAALEGLAGLMGKVALVGTGALAAGLGASVAAASSFEQTMSGVKAVSGATAEEMKQLSGLALQLGKDTSFSAAEAGKGLEELVKGGVSIPEIMNGAAKATLNLAAAGGVDLASAAEIAANAMSMFGLKGKDMAMVANQIAGAANASSLGVDDFRLSLQQVGAVANVAGQSFESTAQAIAVMGAAGIKGSDAGTSLKTFLLNLQPQTKAAALAMAELGIVTADGANQFFDAAGKTKSMTEIAGVLAKATAGLTEQEKLQALQTMFGTDAMRASAIMAKAGAEGFSEMAASMGKVTAESVANERLNNLRGSLEQLKGSLETAAITAGVAFTPALKGLTDGATAAVNGFIPLIEQYGPRLAEMFSTIAAVVTGPLQKALKGDFVGALALMGATLDYTAGRIGEQVQGWAKAFVDWVGPVIPPLLGELARLWWGLETWLIGTALPAIVTNLGAWGRAFVDWVGPQIPPLLLELGRLADQAFQWVVAQVPGWAAQLATWANEFIAWVQPQIPLLLTELGILATGLLDWIILNGPPLAQKFLSEWVPAAISWVAQTAIDILPKLLELALSIGAWILGTGVPKLTEFALKMGQAIVEGIWQGISDFGGWLWDKISTWIDTTIVAGVKNQLGIHSPSTVFHGVGENLVQGMADGIEATMPAMKAALAGVVGAAAGAAATVQAIAKTWTQESILKSGQKIWYNDRGEASFENDPSKIDWSQTTPIDTMAQYGFDPSFLPEDVRGKLYDHNMAIGQNAGGTDYWRGGLTWVGEEGPEIVDLPRGSRVYPSGAGPSFDYDRLGSAVASALGEKVIVFTIDGREVGRVALNYILNVQRSNVLVGISG